MKTINKLRCTRFIVGKGRSLSIGRIYYELDFDVYLPSRGFNLQRELCWTLEQKRELIMSVLLERTIPPLSIIISYKQNDENPIMEIIDGKQRLSTLLEFMEDEFSIILEGKEYLFSQLPEDYQVAYKVHNIEYNSLSAHDYSYESITDQDKIDWFKRINFGGTEQDKAHMEKLKSTTEEYS